MNRIPRAEFFAAKCHEMHITRAVEVGTHHGVFARDFLRAWKGELLICVDPYLPYDHMPYERTLDMMIAAQTLAPFAGRVFTWRAGREIVPRAAQNLPRFIYIDADHEYESVKADLEAWWPIVPSGGLFAGHDYMQNHEHHGVVTAVDEFFGKLGIKVEVDFDSPRSWWVIKP